MSNKPMKFSPKDFDGFGTMGQEVYVVSDPDKPDFGSLVISQDNDGIMPFVLIDGRIATDVGGRMVRKLGVQIDFADEFKFKLGDAVMVNGREVEGERADTARPAIVTAIDKDDDVMGVRCTYVDEKGGYDWRPRSAILSVTQVAHDLKPL